MDFDFFLALPAFSLLVRGRLGVCRAIGDSLRPSFSSAAALFSPGCLRL